MVGQTRTDQSCIPTHQAEILAFKEFNHKYMTPISEYCLHISINKYCLLNYTKNKGNKARFFGFSLHKILIRQKCSLSESYALPHRIHSCS